MYILPRCMNRKPKYQGLDILGHRRLSGHGKLIRGRMTSNCDFLFEVNAEASPSIVLEFPLPGIGFDFTKDSEHGYSNFKHYRFTGRTNDNRLLSAQPIHIHSEELDSNTLIHRYVASANNATLTNKSVIAKPPYKLLFGLCSLTFFGLETSVGKGFIKYRRNTFEISIQGHSIRFIEDPRVEDLKNTQRTRIMSWIECDIRNMSQIIDLVHIVDDLCSMISIVLGLLVNWRFWRLYDSHGFLVREHYTARAASQKHLKSAEVLDNFHIKGGLKRYLEMSFSRFRTIKKHYDLNRLTNYLSHASEQTTIDGYLLYIIPAAEHIASHILKHSRHPYIHVKPEDLHKLSIEDKLRLIHNQYTLFQKHRWKSIVMGIRDLLRNPLFHEGRFKMDPLLAYGKARFLHLICILLYFKTIKYNGKYIDFTDAHNKKDFPLVVKGKK